MPCFCIAFVHARNASLLFCSKACLAIVVDRSGWPVVSGKLAWFKHNADVSLSVNRAILCDTVDTCNGCAVSDTAENHHSQQDINDCSISDCFMVQFAAHVKMSVLKMDAHLAGCVTKTLNLSSRFARSFLNYARHYAEEQIFLQMQNIHFDVHEMSADKQLLDISSSCNVLPSFAAAEESTENSVIVHEGVFVVMTWPHQLWIDYHWYYNIDVVTFRS